MYLYTCKYFSYHEVPINNVHPTPPCLQRCCDGVIQTIMSPTSCCCGKKAFNPDDEVCCEDKLSPRTPADIPNCCCTDRECLQSSP